MSKPDRNWPGVYAATQMHACPGYKRPCGVLTPRPWCYFCQRTKDRESK